MGKGLTSFLSCKHPKTSSFRDGTGCTGTTTGTGTCIVNTDAIYKTMNSMYLDKSVYSEEEIEIDDTEAEPEETASSVDDPDEECLVLHQIIHSDRLFFEPSSTSCSILEKCCKEDVLKEDDNVTVPFKESFLLAMESTDPYNDFRVSMEEMVAAHGLTDWTRLEELLVWYLRVNGKKNHAFIIQAFVDLLVGLVPVTTGLSTSEESSSSSTGITSSCITFDEAEGSESNTN